MSDELRAFVEKRFVDPAPLWDRDHIRSEALAEALAAELVIETDGTVVSRVGAQEFYRVRLPHTEGELSELSFDKALGANVRLLFWPPIRARRFNPTSRR